MVFDRARKYVDDFEPQLRSASSNGDGPSCLPVDEVVSSEELPRLMTGGDLVVALDVDMLMVRLQGCLQ